MMFNRIVHLGRFQLSIFGGLRVKDMPKLLINPIKTYLILEGIHFLPGHVILPILVKGLDCITDPNQKISSTLAGGLPHVFDCIPLFKEHQGTTLMITDFLHDQTEVRSVMVIDSSNISFERGDYLSHEILVLIVISVMSDNPGPAPKGTGHIMRMSIFTPEFWNVYLVIHSGLLLLFTTSPSGHCSRGV